MDTGNLKNHLIPAMLTILRGVKVTREILSKSLRELADEVERGRHVPDGVLQTAAEDSEILTDLFKGKV